MRDMDTTVSSKGQIVLPKAVRTSLNWTGGTRLSVEQGDDWVVLRRKPRFAPTTVDDVSGMFKIDRPITDEEIDNAIEAEVHARRRRKG
jgi:AbrB family looped-hinge helix DNA binding protein